MFAILLFVPFALGCCKERCNEINCDSSQEYLLELKVDASNRWDHLAESVVERPRTVSQSSTPQKPASLIRDSSH